MDVRVGLWRSHLMQRADSLEKTLMLGGIGVRRRRGRQRMRWLDGITDSMQSVMSESEWTLGVGDGQGGLVCCDSWGRKESDTTEQLNWTECNNKYIAPPMNYSSSSLKKKKTKNLNLSRLLYVSRWQEINGIEEHLKQYQEVAISKNTIRWILYDNFFQ